MITSILYRHNRILAAPHTRTSRDDAQLIARLADKVLATAEEFGVSCTRREALARARHNLAYVRSIAPVSEAEWMA